MKAMRSFSAKFISKSEEETENLGRLIGKSAYVGLVVALVGELGSGKTVFARGLARGLGIDYAPVTSPTFVIVNRYDGRLPFFHVDFYRLERLSEMDELGLDEMAKEGVVVIEWADRFADALPAELLKVDFKFVSESETKRDISLIAFGANAIKILNTMDARLWR